MGIFWVLCLNFQPVSKYCLRLWWRWGWRGVYCFQAQSRIFGLAN